MPPPGANLEEACAQVTGWIVKVHQSTPDHEKFAMEDGFWDIRRYSAFKNIAPGDDVYFWIGGGKSFSGLHGFGRVKTPLQELTSDLPAARWIDREGGEYTHRFTFEPLADGPTWKPSWSEIEGLIGKNLAPPAPANPIVDPRQLQLLRGLYIDGSAKETDIAYGTTDSPSRVDEIEPYIGDPGADTREFTKRAISFRRGTKKFRDGLLAAYHAECAVTRSDMKDALEAAHIDPYRGVQTNHVQNGLLLRADIHTLFDLHHLTVDAAYRVVLSPELTNSTYRDLDGVSISLPDNDSEKPSPEALARHRADCGWYRQNL